MTNNDELEFIAKAALKAGQGSKEMAGFRVTANPANILALLAERDADKKRIAELEESHKKLRETMAAIHNTIRADGAYTPLAAIMSGVKRAYEDSAAVAGIKLEVGE